MSILKDKMNEYEVDKTTNNGNQETVNIPLKITAYEDNMFVGVRLDNKEEIRVKMRDVKQTGENKRPSVEDFSNKKSKRYAPIGSTLMLESSYEEEAGIWNTRWASALSTPKTPSSVVVLNTNVNVIEKDGNGYVEINVLKEKVSIDSLDKFKETMLKAFTSTCYRAKNSAIITLSEEDGTTFTFKAFPNLVAVEGEDKMKVMDTPESSLDIFLNDKTKSGIVLDLLDNDSVKIEIFIASRLFLGFDTNKKIFEDNFKRDSLKNEYGIDEYKQTIISIRKRPNDGSLFVSAIKPLVNNSKSIKIENIKLGE